MAALLNSHSDLRSFMDANGPNVQEQCGKDEKRAVMSKISPTLLVIDKSYGEGSAMIWLCKQLADFNEYVGKREKMDDWQITNLARIIATKCSQLKASEIMLFLYQYKTGTWGPLYGVVDPQEFMVVLREKFIPWRARKVEEAENEQRRRERESWRETALKPDEIRKLKERIQQINKGLTT